MNERIEKFTPGPWLSEIPDKNLNNPTVRGQKVGTFEIYSKESSAWIAQVLGPVKPEGAANAALIKVAPEMYEKLKYIAGKLELVDEVCGLVEEIEELLERARKDD